MPYSEHWRRLRTIVHQLLTPRMSATFKPSQLFESKQLVYDILHHNDGYTGFYQHCRRYTTSVIMASTYGRRVPTWENEDIKEIYSIVREFAEVTAYFPPI
jgi:cytochrome P450